MAMNKRLSILSILLSWIAVFLWMVLIFYLSSQAVNQSNSLSEGLSTTGLSVVKEVAPSVHFNLNLLNHIVRKNAHFFAYLVLGILVLNAQKRSGLKGRKRFMLALVFCVLYAVSDEIHQFYVPGRGAQLRDVLIDSAGVFAGSGLYKVAGKTRTIMTDRKCPFSWQNFRWRPISKP